MVGHALKSQQFSTNVLNNNSIYNITLYGFLERMFSVQAIESTFANVVSFKLV